MASRSPTLDADEQTLARATKQAIQAAGGLEVVARETGLSTSQLSRCCSPNHHDSITERDAAIVDDLTHGREGHPIILRARARLLNCAVIELPKAPEDDHHLTDCVTELTMRLGDLAHAVFDALHPDGPGGTDVTREEAASTLDRLHDLETASARLRSKLERIASVVRPST